ncbi:uncharacterized protein EV154DRAFT_489636 [Mucor mucedo]|uniref:Uncharacterized protein n=1 Tax=Mucor saturninus TaxID=64648 RepID=A0A8H7V8Q8_9FUNG|nr:uncharacterized protein EV154DRAFT_489636 [Mucor mucedo]KAG2214326.1 hypothetical protein INT47_000882 [Mucor saturninus]KAI7897301.1 hypothetical protein EV154DRAFT_489636 [Mucor mucedo]
MGLIDKIKNSYDYYKVDKYTKRRVSQSQFESHDRRYYENAYRDGDYVNPQDLSTDTSSQHSRLSYKPSRWSFHDLMKSKKQLTVATSQLKTSETYTYGGRG